MSEEKDQPEKGGDGKAPVEKGQMNNVFKLRTKTKDRVKDYGINAVCYG